MAGGRPTFDYDPVIGEEIAAAISTTSKSLATLYEENPHCTAPNYL